MATTSDDMNDGYEELLKHLKTTLVNVSQKTAGDLKVVFHITKKKC